MRFSVREPVETQPVWHRDGFSGNLQPNISHKDAENAKDFFV